MFQQLHPLNKLKFMYHMAAEHRMSATQVALTRNHAKDKNEKLLN
jgi:hypothetical protein